MNAIELKGDRFGLSLVSTIILSDHVIECVDYRIRGIVALHYLFKDLENGVIKAYAVLDDKKCIGVVWGEIERNIWQVHAAFLRNTDTQQALKLIEDQVVPKHTLSAITAYIPVINKSAQFMFARFGAKRTRILEQIFQNGPNEFIDCQVMTKEY